jgi:hypothetical protein
MGDFAYVVGIVAGFVEGLFTFPWLAAANFLSMNVMEHGGRFYQVLPFPVRELSWYETHIVLPLVNTRVFDVVPATTVIWLVSILLFGILGYYVAKYVIRGASKS